MYINWANQMVPVVGDRTTLKAAADDLFPAMKTLDSWEVRDGRGDGCKPPWEIETRLQCNSKIVFSWILEDYSALLKTWTNKKRSEKI